MNEPKLKRNCAPRDLFQEWQTEFGNIREVESRPVYSEHFKQERIAWLRKEKRAPLKRRFKDVFGEDGLSLHDKLKVAHRQAGSSAEQPFDKYARTILRACSEISLLHGGRERRNKYIQRCIENLEALTLERGEDDEDDGVPETPTLVRLARSAGTDVERVWMRVSPLIKLYHSRWPNDDDRAGRAFMRVIENAIGMKYPLKYLRVVIHNERQRHSQ